MKHKSEGIGIYEGDVLEHALNKGIVSASNRFNISRDDVYKTVRKFKSEVELPCSCEAATLRGETQMCFLCDKHPRILV